VELEPRTTAPAHATGAVAFVALSGIAEDPSFRLREEGDVSALAASIGRLGQLVPVELREIPGAPPDGPRYQVVAGFRRLAALRLLLRDRALARVHAGLSDEDAWSVALVQALLGEPLLEADLRTLSERIAEATLPAWAEDLVDEALVRAPVDPLLRERFLEFLGGPPAGTGEAGGAGAGGEGEETVEVTPEELADDLAARLSELNQDLAVAAEAWKDLPRDGRRRILEQARYVAELHGFLTRDEGDR
jgi:hypothetical protein